jgi:Copper type II ascorbate-dependent monooxygenase, C-terminal domain/Copper type II ascorbate-dependent monooxygenase, N-terminal domain
MLRSPALPLVSLALGLAGCGDGAASSPALTYWDDVAPITEAKCVQCHRSGGIAPFRLDGYDEVKGRALAVATATRTGVMPPYLLTHDGSCGQFEDADTLTPMERDTIWQWANGDLKEGKRTDRPRSTPTTLETDAEWKTPAIVPVAQGGALAEVDEYRCFAFDSKMLQESFITGYEVLPGSPELVHHVVVFLVDPDRMSENGKTNGELMTSLDDEDPARAGWPCYSGAGEGVEPDAVPVVWAPGQGPVIYPGGLGVLQQPKQTVVVQIHYNLADARVRGLSDATTVRFRHADTVARRGFFIAEDGFLATLFKDQPASLAPGKTSVNYTWRSSLEDIGIREVPYVDLVGVMPHMHQRGVRKRIDIVQETGERSCAARLDRWDFHWQKFYFYKGTLPRLSPRSQIDVSCDYDTSADRFPILPGWGTRNEMCTAIMMFALPMEGAGP